jgi:hypothetical protein
MLAILPRSVVKGAIGDILGLAVFIITIYTQPKIWNFQPDTLLKI